MDTNAFHGDPAIKAKYLARVRAHREADNLVQGTGWENGKGCAIGCILEDYNHELFPSELGLPVWLAYLTDKIFEGLSSQDSQYFPEQLLAAIPEGADVAPVQHHLGIRRMDRLIKPQQENDALSKTLKSKIINVLAAAKSCHEAELGGTSCDWSAVEDAADTARYAADTARYAARYAAWSARSAVWSAAWSARSAVWSAAWSARYAAWSARYAARSAWSTRSAVWSAARSAWSTRYAVWSAASSAAFKQEANDLIELLSALPVDQKRKEL